MEGSIIGLKAWIWNLLVLETKRCRMAEKPVRKGRFIIGCPAEERPPIASTL
jgi:hypothetical protein